MNSFGETFDNPAGLNATVVTSSWSATITNVARGNEIVDLYNVDDYRTRALAEVDPTVGEWLAFKVQVTNLLGHPSYFPPTGFVPIGEDGSFVTDFLSISSPASAIDGLLDPGSSRSGWVVFRPLEGTTLGNFFCMMPFRTDSEFRYFSLVSGSNAGNRPMRVDFNTGDLVVTTEDGVNFRKDSSIDAEVIRVLPEGSQLSVDGGPVVQDDYRWYPVVDLQTGVSGFVVSDYLAIQ